MAVEMQSLGLIFLLTGLAADTKPTAGVLPGSTFYETDTGFYYLLSPTLTWLRVPATTLGEGQNLNKTLDPPAQNYPPGVTILQNNAPPANYQTLLPSRWTIPGKPAIAATVPGVRFVWSDGTFTTRGNSAIAQLTEQAGNIYFAKDGLVITSIQFIGTNPGALENVNFGLFTVEGWAY